MAKLLKGLLIDVENETSKVVEIEDELENFYKILKCRYIDITARKIDGRAYEIVLDDEGLLVDFPRISAIDSMNRPMLAGNLFICRNGKGGELDSLTQDDIEHLRKCVRPTATVLHTTPYPMLQKCDYAF